MSLFLGPIHHWLYNKVQVASERSLSIEDAFKHAFGDEADPLLHELDDKFPAFPTGLPLEDIIGNSPIHTFLQGVIKMVETREGAIVRAFVDKYGDKAKEIACKATGEEGQRAGEKARGEIDPNDLKSIYKALYDHQLDGMPCDQGAAPEFDGDTIKIRQSECLHRDNWKEAGAPLDVMCHITGSWIEGFLKGAAPDLSCKVTDSIIGGAGECRFMIEKG